MKKILIVDVPEGNMTDEIRIFTIYGDGMWLKFTEITPPTDKEIDFQCDNIGSRFGAEGISGAFIMSKWYKKRIGL